MRARGIDKPYSFLVKSGMTYHAAQNLLNNPVRSIRFDHMELLCKILLCEPNDLFVWKPGKTEAYPSDFPLYKLHYIAEDSINDTLSRMPFSKLREMAKAIRETDGDATHPA